MNIELIAKLSKQAAEHATRVYPEIPRDEYREHTLKFTELIIEECLAQIHVADVGDLKGKGYYLDKVAEHIEKHFGVEK